MMRAQRLAANNSPTRRRGDGGARCVYALKLNTPGMPGFFKWYVGITENLDDRYEQHRIGRGAEWTKLYPPVEIDDHMCSLDPFVEDLWTKRYMMMYGTDNVRGGSYVRIILPPEQHISLLQEFRTAANQCSKCGSPYHFTTRCNDARAIPPQASSVTPVGESRNMVLMDSIVDSMLSSTPSLSVDTLGTGEISEQKAVSVIEDYSLSKGADQPPKSGVDVYYGLRGNTFPIKDELRFMGGKWDDRSKIWTVGLEKKEQLEALLGTKL